MRIDGFRIAVFDSGGAFIRTLGGRGSGPGEFIEIRDMQIGRGDTLYVLHDASISVFSPITFEYVRSSSSRAARTANHLGVLADGSVVTGRTITQYRAPREDLVWIHRWGFADPVPGGLTTTDTAASALFVRNDSTWLLREDYQLFQKTTSSEWAVVTQRPWWFAKEHQAAFHEEGRPPYLTIWSWQMTAESGSSRMCSSSRRHPHPPVLKARFGSSARPNGTATRTLEWTFGTRTAPRTQACSSPKP